MSTPNTGQSSGDQGATPPGTPPAGQASPAQPPSGTDGGQQQPGQSGAPGDDAATLKKALERERTLRRDAEKRAKDGEAAQKRADELEQAGKSDQDKAVAAARREAAIEAMTKANGRLVAAEARALAAEAKFRDPRDAARFLDLADVRVAEDGTVDTDAIGARLAKLAEEKPYLLQAEPTPPPESQGPRPPRPDPSQGSGRQPVPSAGSRGAAEAARRYGQPASAGTATH